MPKNIDAIVLEMKNCEQTKGQSVFQHGESVRSYFLDLIRILQDKEAAFEWRLPDFILEYKKDILENTHPANVFLQYVLYHDCGKPFCKIVDTDGRTHFPNHAEVSSNIFLENWGDKKIAKLIGWDMVIHTATAEEIEHYCKNEWTIRDAITLVLSSLSEVHSNANLFGGIGSDSFKIKWKKIDKRGRKICKYYFERGA